MRKSLLLLIGISLCVAGCKKNSKTVNNIPSSSISFSASQVDSIIGQPISVHFVNEDSLLINDNKGNPLLKMFDIKSGKQIYSAGFIGNGPNEVIPPIRVTSSRDSVYILSLSSKKVYGMPVSQSSFSEITQLPPEVMGIYHLPKYKIFIAPVMSFANQEEGIYAYVYDSNFNKIQNIEGYALPWSEESKYDMSAISRFHQIQGVCVTDDGTIGIIENYILRLLSFQNGKIINKKDIQLFPYEYDFRPSSKGSLLPKTDLRAGFISGARDIVSKSNTFLISVDNSVKGAQTEKTNIQLILLNSSGELLEQFSPDVNLSPYPMTVSEDGTLVMFSDTDNIVPLLTNYPK